MNDQMDLIVVVTQLKNATERLSDSSKQIFKLAKLRAETERDYRMELSKQIRTLRAEGVQATLIPDLARGACADLKFERDNAHEYHRSAIAAMESLQTEIQSWQSILRRMDEV